MLEVSASVLSHSVPLHRPQAAPAIKPLSNQLLTWVLVADLFCYACNGMPWLRDAGQSNALGAQYGAAVSSGSGTADNAAVMGFLLLTLSLPMLLKARAIMRVLRKNAAFILIPAWISLSFLWSQIPFVTLEWIPASILIVLFACYLHCRFDPEKQLSLFLLLGTVCLLLSVMLSAISSGYRDGTGGWSGVYSQKNVCCMMTEFLLLPVFFARGKGMAFNLFRIAYGMASIFLILMTRSATGRITLALSLVFVALTKILPLLRPPARKLLLVSGSMLVATISIFGLVAFESIARLLGKDPTLTGRTTIWTAMIPAVMKHPLLGYGYRAFWRGYQGESAYISLAAHWAAPNAHNAILEIWVTLGAVGVFLVLFTIVKAVGDGFLCLTNSNANHLAWYASIVVLMLLVSVDEAEMVSPFGLMWLLYILACLGLSAGVRGLRLRPARA